MIMMADSGAAFREGELVRHRRYGYRAVVVSVDMSCEADDGWYQSNQTRPNRTQPWYHVFVDGDHSVRYAAQSSLEPDSSTHPIDHPLIPAFFTNFTNNTYIRNNTPWPT
jgi:heat shock protein HspQ